MKIALDYDGTYTADPEMWDQFIDLAKKSGHSVAIVSMRYQIPTELISNDLAILADDVIYTGRKAKKDYVQSKGKHFDIWIDDNPEFILQDAWTGD